MSSQKSAIELLSDLETQLVETEKNYNALKNAVEIIKKNIQNQYSVLDLKKQQENNQKLDFLGMTTGDAALKFLIEIKKICTTEEIANAIYARGIKGKFEIKEITTGSALHRLEKRGEVIKVGRGTWKMKENNTIENPNEHEQL